MGCTASRSAAPKPQAVAAAQNPAADTVYVADFAWHRHQGVCTCGWRGRRRLLRSIAVLDAHSHVTTSDHQPAVPLVIPGIVNAHGPASHD